LIPRLISSLVLPVLLLGVCAQSMAQSVAQIVALEMAKNEPVPADKPNILLIVADDLGYGDIGAFGGEIHTPNIDLLASQGLKFTSFHTQASCSPARSMLLTGVDNHLNGMGTMAEDLLPHHTNLPGYVGHLNHQVLTVASRLKGAGYHTLMSGKWHLGFKPQLRPFSRGFESTFALLNGTANHYNEAGPNAAQTRATYTRNGQVVSRPKGYSSDLFTDELIQNLDLNKKSKQPFFAYLSFTAPHWPLQAPRSTIEKYKNTYDSGWDKIREKRFASMRDKGLIPDNVTLPARVGGVPAWDALSKPEQAVESRKMAVYAAMVDNLDFNIGRLVRHLKAEGEYENTLIIFMSDNGTDPYDRSERGIYKDWIGDNYRNNLENIGNEDSYTFYGPGWAQVGSVHHRYYKFLPTEGGTHAPLVISYPKLGKQGELKSAFFSVLDITPTILDLAGIEKSEKPDNESAYYVPSGRSILSYLTGASDSVYLPNEAVAFELFGHSSVYMGQWKALSLRPPWGNNAWALYDLSKDPAETLDLSEVAPEKLETMIEAYAQYKLNNKVITEPENATAYPVRPRYIKLRSEANDTNE